jgi:hypothetical protein
LRLRLTTPHWVSHARDTARGGDAATRRRLANRCSNTSARHRRTRLCVAADLGAVERRAHVVDERRLVHASHRPGRLCVVRGGGGGRACTVVWGVVPWCAVLWVGWGGVCAGCGCAARGAPATAAPLPPNCAKTCSSRRRPHAATPAHEHDVHTRAP